MDSIYKDRYNDEKSNLNIWIDKDIKLKLKQGAKRRGLLFGKYVERILSNAVKHQDGVKEHKEEN